MCGKKKKNHLIVARTYTGLVLKVQNLLFPFFHQEKRKKKLNGKVEETSRVQMYSCINFVSKLVERNFVSQIRLRSLFIYVFIRLFKIYFCEIRFVESLYCKCNLQCLSIFSSDSTTSNSTRRITSF